MSKSEEKRLKAQLEEKSRKEILQLVKRVNEKNGKLKTALRACQGAAGNPDPAEGCRLVLKIAEEALKGAK